jgi:RNA polymerase sigma-70 factor (ECF subfamily)
MWSRGGQVTVMSTDDEAGFRALFEEQLADLWRFARRRVGTAADADDIAADTFAVAWRRRDHLPAGPDVRLWLFGVARNVLANHRRGEDRRRRLHLRLVSASRPTPWVQELDPPSLAGVDPELDAALAGLSDSERDVLVMRCWDGLAVHEIATLLGCTPNAVSLRLHKARRRLAEKGPARAGQVADDPLAPKDPRHA